MDLALDGDARGPGIPHRSAAPDLHRRGTARLPGKRSLEPFGVVLIRAEPAPTITASAFTSALSLAANGVSIVTTAHEGRRAGLTVSSMCSVCAEPALLLVCVNAGNEFCALTDASQRFAVNILGEHQQRISNVFAGIDGEADTDRFVAAGEWTSLSSGAPILSDALVSLDCELDTTLERGTHRVFFGRVVDVRTTRGEPLVYTARGYAEVRIPEL